MNFEKFFQWASILAITVILAGPFISHLLTSDAKVDLGGLHSTAIRMATEACSSESDFQSIGDLKKK